MIYIQWIVYKINKELRKNTTSLNELVNVYMNVLDCLLDLNRSIFGISVLTNIIASNLANIIFATYTQIFIYRETMHMDWKLFFAALFVFVKLLDLFLLYLIAHITEKEVKFE